MSTTIHVGNLSFSLVEKDLEEYFSKYGKIVDSYIVRRGGRPRGYGFVEFSSTKEADNALAANGDEVSGRVINIELAKGKIVKSNFQGNDNRGGYNNNNNGGYNNGGYNNNNNYRNNNYRNNDGYNNGGYNNNNYRTNNYRNNNNDGYDNSGYNNNRGPRSFNQGGRTFYTLRNNNNNYNNGPRRNNYNNNNNYNNGPRRNTRRPETEKEKSLSTVYVSNLPFSYDEKALANLFTGLQVKTAHVVQTRNGRSRGFGFVEFETETDQLNAIKSKDQTEIEGRTITVKVSLVDKNEQTGEQQTGTEQTQQTTTTTTTN